MPPAPVGCRQKNWPDMCLVTLLQLRNKYFNRLIISFSTLSNCGSFRVQKCLPPRNPLLFRVVSKLKERECLSPAFPLPTLTCHIVRQYPRGDNLSKRPKYRFQLVQRHVLRNAGNVEIRSLDVVITRPGIRYLEVAGLD